MSNVTISEWDDFVQTLGKYKRERAEFDVRERMSRPVSAGVEPQFSAVTITPAKTGFSKAYAAGHGSAWVVEFDDDLANGLYKA